MPTKEEIIDKHTGVIETKDGFVCETCGAKFRTDYEILAHQGNPVIYTQEDIDKARADERAKMEALSKSVSSEGFEKWFESLPEDDGFKIVGKTLVMPSEVDKDDIKVAFEAGAKSERNSLEYRIKNEMLVPDKAYSNLLKEIQDWKANPENEVVVKATLLAKQEQLAEDIRAIEVLYAERHNHLPLGTGEFHIGYLQGLKDGIDALKKKFKVD